MLEEFSGGDKSNPSRASQKEAKQGDAEKQHMLFTKQYETDSYQTGRSRPDAQQRVWNSAKAWVPCNDSCSVDGITKAIKKKPTDSGRLKDQHFIDRFKA